MTDSAPHRFRVLAIDTATPTQAIAVVEDGEVVEHRIRRVAFNHGSSLLKGIDELFDSRSIDLTDIDLFAAGIGPGSFTGLRVGLATTKGLARSVSRPIVGVSSLAALAFAPARIHPEATVVVSNDARRREVYAGAYRWTGDELTTVVDDRTARPDDWIAYVDTELEGPLLHIGDGQTRYPALKSWTSDQLRTISCDLVAPSAVGIARLGRHVAATDGPDDLVGLEPNYIRPSDAVLPDTPPKPMPPDPDDPDLETAE